MSISRLLIGLLLVPTALAAQDGTAAQGSAVTSGSATVKEGDPALATTKQRFSYGLGLQLARSLFQQGITEVDPGALALGIDDMMTKGESRLSVDELRAALTAWQQQQVAVRRGLAEENQANGEQFLAANRGREGVSELETGLQYLVREQGEGTMPKDSDTVRVHYRGWLLDGTEFDSSHRRAEPTTLQVAQVIPGWQQALARMPVGAKWEIWVPPGLAYGAQGAGNTIGPNQTLHFEIQLIAIEEP